jgi:sugar phosphate isomerase/epimerase
VGEVVTFEGLREVGIREYEERPLQPNEVRLQTLYCRSRRGQGARRESGYERQLDLPEFTAERDLAHPDLEVRESAVRYVRELADLASAVGAPLIIIAPTAFLRSRPLASEREEWE